MSPDFNQCPSEVQEIAEKYIMGALSAEQAAVFEEHYVACGKCVAVLEEVAQYVAAMRAAAEAREEAES